MRQMSICKRAHSFPIPQRCSCTKEGRKKLRVSWLCWKMLNELGIKKSKWVMRRVGERRRLVLPCAWLSSKGGLGSQNVIVALVHLTFGWDFMPTWNHPCTYRTDNWDAIMGEK
jgi:hypothetical protein